MAKTEQRIVSICQAAFVAAFGFLLAMSRSPAVKAAGACLMTFAAAYAVLVLIETALRILLCVLERADRKGGARHA